MATLPLIDNGNNAVISGSDGTSLTATSTVPAAGNPAHITDTLNALSGSDKIESWRVRGSEKMSLSATGTLTAAGFSGALSGSFAAPISVASGASATPANAGTINKPAGTVVLDHTTGAVYTLTNSLIVAGVKCVAWLLTNDATGKGVQSVVVDGTAHTAVITLQAAPGANVTIGFVLVAFA